MTSNDTLNKLHARIDALQDQTRSILVQKQQAQSTLDGLDAQREKLLTQFATGDATVGPQLDSLDAQETELRRQIRGGDLVIAANDIAVANLQAQAAPLEEELQTKQFHQNAGDEIKAMHECSDEIEQILELGANKLAQLMGHVSTIYSLSGVRPDGVTYRNQCVTRTEKLNKLVRSNLSSGVWKSPPTLHPAASAPTSLEIVPAISPETALSSAA